MNEVELERLVVRLVGDSEQYRKMLEDAARKTEDAAEQVQQHAGRIEKFEAGLKKYAAAAAELFAAHKAKEFLQDSAGEWDIAEKTAIKLTAALEANGREVESLLEDYKDWASEVQKVTVYGDDTTLMLLKQAETFDLTGETAKKAVQQAQALAAVNDSNAESMIRMTAAMSKGDTETAMMFARMIPQLRGVKNETEFIERYNKLVASGMTVLSQEAGTFSGQMAQLNNDLGDFKEEVGKIITDILKPGIGILKDVVHWFQSLSQEWKVAITVAIGLSAAILTVTAAATALTATIGLLSGVTVSLTAAFGTLIAVVSVGVVYAMVKGINHVSGLTEAHRKLREETARGVDLDVRMKGVIGARFDATTKSLLKIDDLTERREKIQVELDKELVTLRTHHSQMLQAISEYNESLKEDTLYGGGADQERLKQQADYHTEFYDATKKRVEELQRLAEDSENTRSAVAEAALKDMQKELEMMGKTDAQKRIIELREKGVKEAALEAVKAQAALNDEREKFLRMEEEYANARLREQEAVKSYVEELETEIATMNLSEQAKKRFKLELSGVTEEYLHYIDELEYGLGKERERKSLMDSIAETTKQFQTPLEEFTARQKELNDQLAGGLNAETYGRALDAARKKFHDATGASNAFNDSLLQINNTLAGSSAEQRAVQAYLSTLSGGGGASAFTASAGGSVSAVRSASSANSQQGSRVETLLGMIVGELQTLNGSPKINLTPANAPGT